MPSIIDKTAVTFLVWQLKSNLFCWYPDIVIFLCYTAVFNVWAKNTVRVYGGGKADKIWKTIADDQFQEPLKHVQTYDGWREGGRMEGVGENEW